MEGLHRAVQWYMKHGFNKYWDNEAVEASLEAHPNYFGPQTALQDPASHNAKAGLS